MLTRLLLWFAAVGLALPEAVADDWPQFRGPNGRAIAAADADVPTEWSETKNLAWKTELPGKGSSSPVVKGDFVYVICYSGYGTPTGATQRELKRHLVCLNRKTGDIEWTADVPPALPEDGYRGYIREHGYASNTPVVDDDAIYCFFGKSGAARFTLKGAQVWRVSLGMESSNREWGSAASPILYKNMVIVNASEESRAIWALDKETGETIWKADGDKLELCYSTPALVEVDGHTELVVPVPGEVWGLNADTGKLKWFIETGLTGNISPSVAVEDGVAYVFGGFRGSGSLAVKCGGKGDVTDTHVLWTSRTSSYVPSPLVIDGRLYWVDDRGLANCADAKTGESFYRERLRGAKSTGFVSKPFYASVIKVGDKLICPSRRSGTFVIKLGEEFEQLAQNELEDDSDFNATPAVVGDQMFLRSDKYVYCVSQEK